jgi:hypothetical protein
VVSALTAQFKNVETETATIPQYNFKWTISVYLLAALIISLCGLFIPVAGIVGTLIIGMLATREFYRPLLAKFHTKSAKNLYFTIPARSKETQKLFIVTTYTTDQPFPKPQFMTDQRYLNILSLLFFMIPIVNAFAYFAKASHLIYLVFLPVAAILHLAFFNHTVTSTQSSLENCTVLDGLKALLLKARPLSTTVTFALIGTRAMNSGILALSEKIKSGPKLTYIVNLTEASQSNQNTLQIITSEGSPVAKAGDPTLVELLQIVAEEKEIDLSETKLSGSTEIFPLLLRENKVVSVGKNQMADSSSNRDLRELLAGLIRKLEH